MDCGFEVSIRSKSRFGYASIACSNLDPALREISMAARFALYYLRERHHTATMLGSERYRAYDSDELADMYSFEDYGDESDPRSRFSTTPSQ